MNSDIANPVALPSGGISQRDREAQLNQNAVTVWITGLSAAGKSTLAYALEKSLYRRKVACYVLDGDNIRHGLNKNLGFSTQDRMENIRRVAEVAHLMNDAGLVVIAALISPRAADRAMAEEIIGPDRFIEVYLNTPLEICEARDPKGLYAKARDGSLKEFTGISASYESPIEPTLTINTKQSSIQDSVNQILAMLKREFMSPSV